MAPAKALPMNMFMMYMAGRAVSIFPIMMVAMMLWRPFKALLAVNATFKPLEASFFETEEAKREKGGLVLYGHPLIFLCLHIIREDELIIC